MNAKQFKENLDNLDYDQILEHRFRDLKYYKTGENFGTPELHCTFTMSKSVWDSYRKIDGLGQIYNCDLSNYLSRKGVLNEYCVPIVNDQARAKNGIKTITVVFRLKGHPYRP